MNTLTIIDTFGFFFRSFYALPPLKNAQGFPTGLLVGFCNLLQNLYKDPSCTYIAFALEGGGESKRKALFSEYKANRGEAPMELKMQLPIAIKWIEQMGFLNLSIEGYEADDIIASLKPLAHKKHIALRIISHDKDLYQLIDENTYIYDPIHKKDIKEAQCVEKYGVKPSNFIDYQALVGDSADNVAGIKGIGAKSAEKLINHFGSIEAMYARESELDALLSPRLANLVREGKDSAFLSKKLVRLHDNLLSDIDLSKCLMPESNPMLKIIDELRTYELNNIISKLNATQKSTPSKGIGSVQNALDSSKDITNTPDSSKNAQKLESSHNAKNAPNSFSFKAHLLDTKNALQQVLDTIPPNATIGFDCESDSLDTKVANLVGFSFCIDGYNAYYVPIGHNYLGVAQQVDIDSAKVAVEQIFTHPIIGHNLKFDLNLIYHTLGITHNGAIYDSMILAWLFNSIAPVGLDKQMLKWFNHKMISFDSLVGKNESFAQVNITTATQYAAEDAAATLALYHKLESVFKERGLEHILALASRLEYPFIRVLMAMENEGIKVDITFLQTLKERASEVINNLSSEIFTLSGESFNLNSPQQLAHILFDKLGLKAGRSIKGGHSTDEKTLLELLNSHEVIASILEYREINKLKSTYIEPLLRLGSTNKNHRIYTSFLQNGTATGRLSSKSPNLQNIPVRSSEGKKIRQAFISKEGHSLISIDYSQIELRLLAHFCQDSSLLEAFKQDKDIHLQTAIKLFGESLAQEKRAIAKSINFGLIYGMGSKKLSQTLQIPLKAAKSYIEQYFALFPTIKDFLRSQEARLLESGFVETLLGHRRYFDFSNATEFMKSNFLREGINAIFQGSAADLIKLSMCEIFKIYQHSDLKMLLQVHDELIFEAPNEKAQGYATAVAEIMNNIYTLRVPLKCGISIGHNWAELK